MKKLLFLLLLLPQLLPVNAFSQSPEAFNYQAVVRDGAGNILAGQAVSFLMNIREGSPSGTVVYAESHTDTTNSFGLVNLQIGQGTVVSGTFSSISWGSNPQFLEIELDENGGTNYTQMGVQQLISVPYALHASTVENDAVDDADADPFNELQAISLSNDTLYLSNGGSVFLGNFLDNTDQQTLSYTGDTLFISNGNSVVLPSGAIDTDDQTLSLNNDSLIIADGNSVFLGPYLDNTDAQTLSLNNDSLTIAGGNRVFLGPYLDNTDAQTLSLNNDSLTIAGGNRVFLGPYLDNTDAQTLSLNNDSLTIAGGNRIFLGNYLDNTDAQTLSINNDSVFISNGNGLPLPNDNDWGISGLDMHNLNSGNIGINTTTPLRLLHVNQGSLLSTGANNTLSGIELLPMAQTSNGGGRIFFREDNNDDYGFSLGFTGVNGTGGILNWPANSFNISHHNGNPTGEIALTINRGNGFIGLDTILPAERLHVKGSIRMNDGNEAAGYVAVSDGDGTMIWTDPATIIDTLSLITDLDRDTRVEVEANADEDKIRYFIDGSEAFMMQTTTTGVPHLSVTGGNIMIGAGKSDSLTGTLNTLVGDNAGPSISSGERNTYFGASAGRNNISGGKNVFVGSTSGFSHDGGLYNVFLGSATGRNNQSGSRNTFLGAWSGYNATSGSGNVFIGYNVGRNELGDNRLYIDNGSTTTPLIWGNFNTESLVFNGDMEVRKDLAGNGIFPARITNLSGGPYANGLLIQAGQNVQTVNNRFIRFARPDGNEIGACRQTGNNSIQYLTTSDRRLKTNFQASHYGLSDLMKIKVLDYHYIGEETKLRTGFIAQQLFEVYPAAVSEGGEDAKADPWMVDYGQLTPILVKSVQEQQATIEKLEERLNQQEALIQELLDRMK